MLKNINFMCYIVMAKAFRINSAMMKIFITKTACDNDKVPVHEKTTYNSFEFNQLTIYVLKT